MNPTVSIVLVSYRTRELVLTALAGLRAATVDVPYEVIVVDNASADGSAEAVAAAFPEVRVVRLAANVGFGRAVNVGAALARGRWLLLINPDTEPVGDPVGALVDYAQRRPEHGIYAGRTLRDDGTDDGRSVFAPPSLWSLGCFATGLTMLFPRSRWLNPEALPALDRSRATPVPAASGCLLLISRELFTRLGGFAPDYFMYHEDVDLCQRAARLGARPVLVPDARVRHIGGAASSSVGKRVMLLRGAVTYLRRHWSPGRARLGRGLLTTGIALRAVGARLTGRAGYWPAVWAQRRTWRAGWPPVAELPPVRIVEPAEPITPAGSPGPTPADPGRPA
jgi:N-acetylglucosaminyl-diphospho-decaprenol L-rhamnosyltransferase